VSLPPPHVLKAEEQLLNDPLYQELRPTIIGFIERLQLASTAEEWFDLHRDLLVEFGARQDAADEALPALKSQIETEIRELAQQDPKPIEELKKKQESLERVRRLKLVAVAGQHILRQIADGISWRALRYDRRAFSILGEGERVGRLAVGIGRDAEIVALGQLWQEEGVFAIHNDLTNCIRRGDLTAIRAHDGMLDVTLIEVKAGHAPEDSPQMSRLKRATELLREGRLLTDEGVVVHLTVVPAQYETYLSLLPDLIARARRDGYAWARPHECLLIGASDFRVWANRADEFMARSVAERRRVGWGGGEPDTLDWLSSLRRIRDRGWSFSSMAPYTIFALPAEDVADVIMGFIDLATSLRLDLLESALSRDDVEVRVARPGEAAKLFLVAIRREVGLELPPHLREQMMVELMTPDSLFAAIDYVLALNEERPSEANDRRVVVFADEADVWGNLPTEPSGQASNGH
jgi:hypothetical protein